MIIFLYGEDEFRSSRKLAEIKQKFLEKNNPDAVSGLFDFSEKDHDLDKIILDASSGSLFSPKQLIVIKKLLAKKDLIGENFLDFLKKKNKGQFKNVILVFWEGNDFDKKNPLAKFLLGAAKCQQFDLPEGVKLRDWIIGEVRKIGGEKIKIASKAVEKLMIYVGNDLDLLSKEIEKLVNYKDSGEITSEDVELLVKSKIDTDIFKTIDALARGDKKTAAKLLHNHLEAGDDPFYLLSMYFFQFRNLLKIKPLAEKDVPEREIASRLKIHPYVAQKSAQQGRKFSLPELKKLYQTLCEIDFQAKTGKVDIELTLDKFIAVI
jgi:DNA polymerase-3 subunit delta